MKETKEIRCINESGQERWISEHLVKDREYMNQMKLTVQDLSVEKTHFESKLQDSKSPEAIKLVEEDEFSNLTEEKEFEKLLEQEKQTKKNK